MKHIFYLLDGFSPLLLKGEHSSIYSNKYKKNNFINKIKKKSIFFENSYGYGETYSTTYSMMTGKDVYKSFCDMPEMVFSFQKSYNLGSFYKSKNFQTIYYRNSSPNYPIDGYYGRYNDSMTNDFDFVCLKKKNKSYDLKSFLLEKDILNKKKKDKNLFFFIHDMSFHDSAKVYSGNSKSHISEADAISLDVKKNLNLLGYKKTVDTLFFLSDHGLTIKPFNEMHTNSRLDEQKYLNYYKNLFIDEKLKFTFFINSPEIKSYMMIKKYIISTDVFKIVKDFNHSQRIQTFLKKIRNYTKNEILISIKNAKGSPYGNFFYNFIYHFHFILIKNKLKFIYSYKHKDKYLLEKNDILCSLKDTKIEKKLYKKVNEYYGLKSLIIRFIFFLISYVFILPTKIIKKVTKYFNVFI